MSIPLTNYTVNGIDLFAGITGPAAPVPPPGGTGYIVNGSDLFTYYTSQGSNYQSNLSKFNYIYLGTPFDIMLYNYFSKATFGTPANATFNKINNRLCWQIKGTTNNVNLRFPYATTINFVAVGGGQIGGVTSSTVDVITYANGGYGGGVVRGQLLASGNNILTISIGGSGIPTTITGSGIIITANAGSSSGTGGSASGVINVTTSLGGIGGIGVNYTGGNGPFIANLGIYVAGGGGREGFGSGYLGGPGGLGGGGRGGEIVPYIVGENGTINTGGGGGGDNGLGGSGVVYLYL
jgi:hypothetical protein